MIDLPGTGPTAALSPPVPAERRDEGGPVFAILLAQAAITPVEAPLPTPVPETAAVDGPEPMAVAEQDDAPIRRAVVDHAIRFDARGMIAMAAGGESVLSDVPDITPPVSAGTRVTAPQPAIAPDMAAQPVTGTVHSPPVSATATPADRASVAKPHPLPVAATPTALGEPAPTRTLADEPEIATAPAARSRTRFAAMAQGAPKVAVVALADGLAVSAAVGALSEGERHRMRDAIAATLSRHGLRPHAVTLLAMPAPTMRMER
ncbi:MAG: hypothetical protein PGN21_10175 [Sphingomonas paucimobilis]